MPFHPSHFRLPGCGVARWPACRAAEVSPQTVWFLRGLRGPWELCAAEPQQRFWGRRAAGPGLVLLPGCLLLATGGSESRSAWSSALLLLSSGCLATMSDTEMKPGSYWGGVPLQLKGLGEDVFVSGGKHAPALACRFKGMGEVPTSIPVLSSLISPQTLGEIPVVVAGHVAWERRSGQERGKSACW